MLTLPKPDVLGVKWRRFSTDENAGKISEELHSEQGHLLVVVYYLVHRDPLRIEAWGQSSAGRFHGENEAKTLELYMNAVRRKLSPAKAEASLDDEARAMDAPDAG